MRCGGRRRASSISCNLHGSSHCGGGIGSSLVSCAFQLTENSLHLTQTCLKPLLARFDHLLARLHHPLPVLQPLHARPKLCLSSLEHINLHAKRVHLLSQRVQLGSLLGRKVCYGSEQLGLLLDKHAVHRTLTSERAIHLIDRRRVRGDDRREVGDHWKGHVLW